MKRYSALLLICLLVIALAGSLPTNTHSPYLASTQEQSAQHTVRLALVASNQGGHPRLFFAANQIASLRAKAATTHQEIWRPIQDYTRSLIGSAPLASAPLDGDLQAYRNYGNGLIPQAFACIITEDPDDCEPAKTHLLTYTTWEQWGEGNQRGLGLAHMLLGNALAYDWLYNMLTTKERQTVRESLAGWAQKVYEASSASSYQQPWDNWWRKSYMQNHYWIIHSALGMASLALLGEDDRAQIWIDHARNQMSRVQYLLNGIEDGSWHESIPYQDYALTMTLPFLINLRAIQGVDIFPHNYLRNYIYWHIYNHLPNSTQFILAYGDFEWSWIGVTSHLLRFAAHEYGNGHAEWMAQQLTSAYGRAAGIWSAPWYVFEFLSFDPSIVPVPPIGLDKARVFPDLEGVIWRTDWGDDALIFGLKTGAYGGRFAHNTFTQNSYPWEPPCLDSGCSLNTSHDHDDSNGFYIYRADHWLAPENEGVGKSRTAFHNTLLIDGKGQYRPPDNRFGLYPDDFIGSDGFLAATASLPDFDYVAADATRRYIHSMGLNEITRHVVFVRPDYFVMLDHIVATVEHQYEWISHVGESAVVEGNWVRGNAGDGQILGIGVAAPQPFATTIGNDGQPYIHIQAASAVDNIRFIHILYPTDDISWQTKPTFFTLANSKDAAAVRVQMNDGSRRTDEVVITYAQHRSTIKVGPYSYDGRVAVVSKAADDTLEKLFVYGGTSLTDQTTGNLLVANLDRDAPFEASYVGSTVAVHGTLRNQVTLYAPQAEHLTINGIPRPFLRSGAHITFNDHAQAHMPRFAENH
jgi:hypothetical protein